MWNGVTFQITYVLLWSTVLLLAVTVLFLGRQVGILYQRVGPAGAMMANPGPELNTLIEQITAQDIDGNPITVAGRQQRRSLIVFVTPGCSSCAELASGIRAISQHERSSLDVVLFSVGLDLVKHQEFRARHALTKLPYIVSAEVGQRMNITTVPYALLLDQEGMLRSKGIVNSLSHLESLLNVIDSGYASVQERDALSSASERVRGAHEARPA